MRDWDAVGRLFLFEAPKILDANIEQAIDQAASVYTASILDVIESQPGPPKTEEWAQRSGSSDLFYGEKGNFIVSVASDGANQKGVRAKQGDKKVFVGARNDIKHHSGFSMADIAGILQNTPGGGSREVFHSAYERVEDELNSIFRSVGLELK